MNVPFVKFGRIFEQRHFREAIRYSPHANYIYLNNPKCGCSTVKYTLWGKEKDSGRIDYMPNQNQVHDIGFWSHNYDFADPTRQHAFTFSIVRNPFARILSAYLDKIVKNNAIRNIFCQIYSVKPQNEISFLSFLEAIRDSPPHLDDQHWRPQTDNILFDVLPIDFIGYLENIEQDLPHIMRKIFGSYEYYGESTSHATGAKNQLIPFFGKKEIDLVLAKYARDFEVLGYGPEITSLAPVRRHQLSQADPAAFAFLKAISVTDQSDEQIIAFLEQATNLDDLCPVYPTAQALVLNRSGDYSAAEACATKAISRNSEYAHAYYAMSCIKPSVNDLASALLHAQRAVELVHYNPQYWHHYANLLFLNKQFDDAELAIQQAIDMRVYADYNKFRPDIAKFYVLVAKIALRKSNQDKAWLACQQALENARIPPIILEVARVYADNDQEQKAIELLRGELNRMPNNKQIKNALTKLCK